MRDSDPVVQEALDVIKLINIRYDTLKELVELDTTLQETSKIEGNYEIS
jgi:hypothetical protein